MRDLVLCKHEYSICKILEAKGAGVSLCWWHLTKRRVDFRPRESQGGKERSFFCFQRHSSTNRHHSENSLLPRQVGIDVFRVNSHIPVAQMTKWNDSCFSHPPHNEPPDLTSIPNVSLYTFCFWVCQAYYYYF